MDDERPHGLCPERDWRHPSACQRQGFGRGPITCSCCRRGRGGRGGRILVGSSGASFYAVQTRTALARRFTHTPDKESALEPVQDRLLRGSSGEARRSRGKAHGGRASVRSAAQAWVSPKAEIRTGRAGLLVAAAWARAPFGTRGWASVPRTWPTLSTPHKDPLPRQERAAAECRAHRGRAGAQAPDSAAEAWFLLWRGCRDPEADAGRAGLLPAAGAGRAFRSEQSKLQASDVRGCSLQHRSLLLEGRK
jgi:hypothetical protein